MYWKITDIVVNALFISILIYASYKDIKTKIIPDKVHLFLIALSLLSVGIVWNNILGFVCVPLIFIISELRDRGAFGGGDIKFIAVCSYYLGLTNGFIGVIIGLVVALVINFCLKKKRFPLVPYLSVGFISVLILQGR